MTDVPFGGTARLNEAVAAYRQSQCSSTSGIGGGP